jgi:predicted GNAT family acetyltransferase
MSVTVVVSEDPAFVLTELLEPRYQPTGKGRLRQAASDDRDLLIEWVRGFRTDVAERESDPEVIMDQRLLAGLFWLWEDRKPVSMAAYTQPTESVVRIQAVYTPPAIRRRGYA